MGLLSRDDIFAADDLKYDEVEVPEWGGSVRVRGLTGTERDSFESSLIDAKRDAMKLDNVRAKLVAKCAVDENGARLFTDADVRELGRKSGIGLNRVSSVMRSSRSL